MLHTLRLTVVLLLACCTSAFAQTKTTAPASAPARAVLTLPGSQLTLERFEGNSMVVPLTSGIKLNEYSTLKREWFVVRDDAAPAALSEKTGIDVSYKREERIGNYSYNGNWWAKVKEPITAIEVRYIVLNVFGRVLKTLTATEVADVPELMKRTSEWRIFTENEASEAFSSVAYVASVRTAAGRVYEINRPALLEQLLKVSRRITEADIEPPKRDPAK